MKQGLFQEELHCNYQLHPTTSIFNDNICTRLWFCWCTMAELESIIRLCHLISASGLLGTTVVQHCCNNCKSCLAWNGRGWGLCMEKWKWLGRKRQWPISRFCPKICLKWLRKTIKTAIRIDRALAKDSRLLHIIQVYYYFS